MSDDVIPLNEIGKIGTVKVYNQAYVDKQQKRITELEGICKDLSYKFDYQVKQVMKLEKETAELKGLKDVATLIRANNDTVTTLMQLNNMLVSKTQQLTKAKELLAKWVELFKPKLEGYPITPIQEQTEQFLNEVEK